MREVREMTTARKPDKISSLRNHTLQIYIKYKQAQWEGVEGRGV
jgi:hypothetical protein